MWLVANVNTMLFESSLKHFGDPTVVGEHNKFLFTAGGLLTARLLFSWSRGGSFDARSKKPLIFMFSDRQ